MADEASPEVAQRRMKEFMSLLPLTLELAGLPKCELGRLFNDGQLDVRASNLKLAYKTARTLLKEIAEGS